MARLEDIIQNCIERLRRGASVEELLLAHPDDAPLLEPMLRSAHAMLTLPVAVAPQSARATAMGRMLNELAAAPVPPAPPAWLAAFLQRPRAFQAAALAGGIALFGVAGIGAAAATGGGPEPVRSFFGLSDSRVSIEFQGVVVSVEPGANTLDVSAGGAIRTVIVDFSTEISDETGAISLDDLAAGDVVEVKGSLQADGTVLASSVHLEGTGDPTATPEPSLTPAPVETPTAVKPPDDDDDNSGPGIPDDDNSGPGNGGDDDDSENNSGPGSGDDGDNSGPDSDANDDDGNSGPGSGGDDGDDDDGDSSGPGSGDDDNDGDGEGPGRGPGSDTGGDDDDDDDNSGGGESGGDDDDD